ncbi:MAG: 3D domain-containing protein [Bacillota bacterium]|jgi:3D (Asp-Asp-Asp) domain-containing protein|nr:3D domain-containing protein [Bacillota bacterium]HHU29085.1 DUF348 domain-containing protein [Bacillota bacterium]
MPVFTKQNTLETSRRRTSVLRYYIFTASAVFIIAAVAIAGYFLLPGAFSVKVEADGQICEAEVGAETVADLLDRLGIELRELDRVEPALQHSLKPGDSVKVIRVEKHFVTRRREIPFQEIIRGNGRLSRGVLRVLQEGIKGIQEETVEITSENGSQVSATVLQTDLLRAKQDFIIEFGENNTLSRSRRNIGFTSEHAVTATAYCNGTEASGCPRDKRGCSVCTGFYNDGYTATGLPAVAGDGSPENPYIIAVDPRVFPLGSRLYLDGYGFAIAADTGSAIKGYCIDILFPTHKEAVQFGRRQMKIYLLPEQ